MQISYGENEIRALLQRVRALHPEIGQYEHFSITESFVYMIKLSNGKIHLLLDDLQDDATVPLSDPRLYTIAARFTPQLNGTKASKQLGQQLYPNSSHQPKTGKKKNTKAIIILVILALVSICIFFLYISSNGTGHDHTFGKGSSENALRIKRGMENWKI